MLHRGVEEGKWLDAGEEGRVGEKEVSECGTAERKSGQCDDGVVGKVKEGEVQCRKSGLLKEDNSVETKVKFLKPGQVSESQLVDGAYAASSLKREKLERSISPSWCSVCLERSSSVVEEIACRAQRFGGRIRSCRWCTRGDR